MPTSGRLPRVLPLLPLPPSSAPSSDASAGSGGNGNNSNSTAASDDISSPVWERIPASSASSSTEGAEPVLTVKVYSCDHDISAHHEPLAAEVTSSLQPLWARFNTGYVYLHYTYGWMHFFLLSSNCMPSYFFECVFFV